MSKLLLIGAGKMATALGTAIAESGLLPVADVTAVDVSPQARENFTRATGIACVSEAAPLIPQTDILLLAVKPQVAPAVTAALPPLRPGALVISICAGIPIASLREWLHTGRVIRVMPNTPLMVGKGASCFAPGPEVTDEDCRFAQQLLGSAGVAHQVKEELLDAVTGLSGSGPAYVFELAKAMALAGEQVGLSADISLDLTLQTIAGAAEMLARRLGSPDELRDAVTSPNGTTAAGLAVMKDAGFRELIAKTVIAARDRSIELGRK